MFGLRDKFSTTAGALETVRSIAPGFSDKRMKILAHADPGKKDDATKVHLSTNLKIRDCLERSSLGTCVHITGRMHAITDPFHSDLCTNIFRKTENPFKFSYFDQEDPDKDPIDIVRQKKIMWSDVDWRTSLSALRKEAQSQIEAYSVAEKNQIQFTVFGEKFVQLQSRHDDEGSAPVTKHVWLIESQVMHDALLEHAETVFSDARLVSANLFREAYDLISGMAAKYVLGSLSKTGVSDFDLALGLAADFHDDPTQVLQALKEFGFLEMSETESVVISPAGRELLGALSAD